METILLIVIGLIICSIVTAILPKEFVYSIVLGIVCGWLMTKLLVYVDTKTAFTEMYFFPSIVGFIRGLGWSVKITCFILLSVFFWITGLSKFLGKSLLAIIGIMVLIFIVALFGLFLVELVSGLGNWL